MFDMFDKKVLNIYAVITGLFFLISGVGKAIDTAAFSDLIYQYGLGYLMILAPVIAVAEILTGLALILLIKPKFYSLVAFILLFIFTISFALLVSITTTTGLFLFSILCV